MVFDLVVSHYSSRLEWLNDLEVSTARQIVIYSKGPIEKRPAGSISLPNVGREGHTYLTYICQNYHQLPERIVFTVDTVVGQKGSDRMTKLREAIRSKGTYFPVLSHEDTQFHSGFSMKYYSGSTQILANPRPYGKWYRRWVRGTLCHIKKTGVSYNGIFSVTGRDIKRFPLKHYQDLLAQLSIGDQIEAGHFMERSWRSMWLI